MTNATVGTVYLVGAGPGDPGLLTLRGAECLARADYVLYDKLVPLRMLAFAPAHAECVSVTELEGGHNDRGPNVHVRMIEQAQLGKTVVRLKGGDPLLFGRGGEESDSLRRAGVPYEIVPGISSGVAAGAYSDIPITFRGISSAVALVTGHEIARKEQGAGLDWSTLARFPGTLVVYMGIARAPQIVEVLMEGGRPADTPVAVVQSVSQGTQRTFRTTLARLPDCIRDEGVVAPAILIIGKVVDLRPDQSWFERRPLFGRRVLVTRPRAQAGELLRRLEELGAATYLLPAVEVRPLADHSAVDAALARLDEFDWLVFTSVNGVDAFLRRLFEIGRDLRALGRLKLAAIGPATADALRRFHLNPDLVPDRYRSEELAVALGDRVAGGRVLLARADRGREVLRETLAGIAHVEQVAVYSQVDAVPTAEHADLLEALRIGHIEFVTLTSSNIARSVLRVVEEPVRERIRTGTVKLVTISPVTSAAVREFGLEPAAEATEYTMSGLVRALVDLARRYPPA
jgi:uroporphyrinogen III methyltransferase/synthase